MLKNNLLLLACLVLVLSSCQKDEAPTYTYPFTVSFVKTQNKSAIQAFKKDGGTVSEITLDETTLDDDEAFTDIDMEPTFDEVTFTSATTATVKSTGDLVIDESTEITYIHDFENERVEFMFDLTGTGAGVLTIAVQGSPEAFTIPSQVYVQGDDSFTLSLQQWFQEDIEGLKEDLNDGETIAVMNYDQIYQ